MLNHFLFPFRHNQRSRAIGIPIKNIEKIKQPIIIPIHSKIISIILLFSCLKITKFLVLAVLKYYNLFVPKINQY